MKKIVIILLFLLFLPFVGFSQEEEVYEPDVSALFTAEVLQVIENQEVEREDGSISYQQHLKLKGLEGKFKDHEFEFTNMGFDVLAYPGFNQGDKVYVYHVRGYDGIDTFYVTDFVRKYRLIWPALIFALLVVLVGKFKGFRALVSLIVSFAIILYFILPQIINGYNPIWITILGSVMILAVSFLLTYWFKRKTYIALASTVVGLVIVALLSILFTAILRFTGFGVENMQFLVGVTDQPLNIKGLLLAGMIIGALGILTDMAISQVSLVEQLKIADPNLSKKDLYKKAMKVGVDHIGSMVNTLALAYAGAALPLLILFTLKQSQYVTFGQIINTEFIAIEIIRTLVGSIGLILIVPLTTLLAVVFITKIDTKKVLNP